MLYFFLTFFTEALQKSCKMFIKSYYTIAYSKRKREDRIEPQQENAIRIRPATDDARIRATSRHSGHLRHSERRGKQAPLPQKSLIRHRNAGFEKYV